MAPVIASRAVTLMAARADRMRSLAFRGQVRLRRHLPGRLELPYTILIGAHHKTGSAWIGGLFHAIADRHGMRFFSGEQADLPVDFDIFFQRHSRFDVGHLQRPSRGLHLIRDPRDVIVSGCFYHERSTERWLQRPRDDLGGMTYQQALGQQPTFDDKLLFEMEHTGRETIEEMVSWERSSEGFIEVRYEDLIADDDTGVFRHLFLHLGFPMYVIPQLLEMARASGLRSGPARSSDHVRSGIPGEWRQYFTPRHRIRFVELFGDALERLGYEPDASWLAAASA